MQQRTIATSVSCQGVGLHSGAQAELRLRPAEANSGIFFLRVDLKNGVRVAARSDSVSSLFRATTLASGDSSVATVEHLLAALFAMGVDNLQIEIDGPEVPVMDGSAEAFVGLLRSAGILEFSELSERLRVLRPIRVADGERRIAIEPARQLEVSYAVDFPHPAIKRQEIHFSRIDGGIFCRELAGARTFGFLEEVDALRRAGLARGASLENAVVLDDTRVLNPEGLRFPDEFVRHKVVDLLGDLSLLGRAIDGHVTVERGGHSLHQALLRELLRQPDAWEITGGKLREPDLRVRGPVPPHQGCP